MTTYCNGILRRRLLAALPLLPVAPAYAGDRFWALLREGGCIVLMRHAQTVAGIGDPTGFRLGDCGTQRNLSEAGREQARRVGQAFTREGIALSQVRSSAWCRCTDTADLAFGQHQVWPAINSFFQSSGGDRQTREVLQATQSLRPPENWMLVTHQVNISALTGDYPAMGEIFVTRPIQEGKLTILARLSI